MPIVALEEALAEKLAAFRRRALVRDLYDLAWFSRIPFDSVLVRKLTYLKVYVDVVEDGLGSRPFRPEADILGRRPSEFAPEDIGLLAGEVNIGQWLEAVRHRFGFLTDSTADEAQWAQCNPRDLRAVSKVIQTF